MIACSCKACSAPFESKVKRTYCSVKCRAADPGFRAVLLANLATPNRKNGPDRAGTTKPCVNGCGTEIYLTATARKRGKKACSRSCWRAWLANRFDRSIATAATIDGVTGFDEFLSQDKLQCLVAGCAWEGAELSLHVNLAHGITAEALKARAGFNRNTGLVSGPLARIYEQRGGTGTPGTLNRVAARAAHPMKSQVQRREALEHHQKAMAARAATKGA